MNIKSLDMTLLYFILAGFCEIGGGYLVWLWIKEQKPWTLGLAGAALLVIYGFVMTQIPVNFGRAYAAYGGIFIVMSLLWGWAADQQPPDIFDLAGVLLVLFGVAIMMYWPRT